MNVRHMGDAGLLVETEHSDAAQNLRRVLMTQSIQGVRQLVPGYQSLLVVVDPLVTDLDTLAQRLPALLRTSAPAPSIRYHEVPVQYGGDHLVDAARQLGMSMEEVVRRHSDATYRVAFLGFTPGFPYLTGLDPKLQLPRLTTPRLRTPQGGVAMAGEFTGIYPSATPGGWHVLGITALKIFDATRVQPALFSPGDQVRFRILS